MSDAPLDPRSITSLDVLLNDLKVGMIVRTPGDFNAFSFEESYRQTGGFPVLSLSFRAAHGGLRKDPKPVARALPSFFANLLPEDKLREAMERHHSGSVRAGNDFDLLAALGSDLPGAVRIVPSEGSVVRNEGLTTPRPKARFSLAGVQMKLSVIKNTGKGGGLTIPLGDEQGSYIAKFPSTSFPSVSENEFANLALAEAVGMDVPERELVEQSQFEGIPEEFETLSDGKVLLVKRFDRVAGGERIHIEDFAQVFGVYPSRKYEGASYHDIAVAIGIAVSSAAALEFVRRLALAVLTGNGDMHLKNWSLIYHGKGDKPALAPVYDVLSTVPYIPSDAMALSLAGERPFKAMNTQRWKVFAHRARMPEAAVLKAVMETVERVNQSWWSLPERAVLPDRVLERIDAHIKLMSPILGTCAN
ncbi:MULTISPECIES: type II toxin-antitoxin system HipA family toxin [Rhizobium/Agrobacterium group]|uniref:type II toxin-antitoxin system HipA family toxin n=1 Tax=Rhizobium/Agrobacterium group TaxID=227290 RepID=UPI00056F8D7C|nr:MULTISPECIES: HipA domain-containing protein [Rhizobium/Agrobacterium group]NIB59463.1 type II toxin-antitoxin system HipA family toxin [Agrobacterium tumefaciens]NSZ24914.1 type II toxin-antitoxin system HipA family toxin [Agrobacterium tumefaciens]NTB21004.1 type II toxin-antitoxin system HipA family toxin [Agrobacterium tumefaciens]QQE32352.1 HipA domain-containing protein [Agrobacterium tumefaciens]